MHLWVCLWFCTCVFVCVRETMLYCCLLGCVFDSVWMPLCVRDSCVMLFASLCVWDRVRDSCVFLFPGLCIRFCVSMCERFCVRELCIAVVYCYPLGFVFVPVHIFLHERLCDRCAWLFAVLGYVYVCVCEIIVSLCLLYFRMCVVRDTGLCVRQSCLSVCCVVCAAQKHSQVDVPDSLWIH